MTTHSVGLARGILRNAAALLLVGVFAKGMGLVIAVLIARFLGTDAMGLFALLFAVAMLLETIISIGMSDSLVRDVAAHPGQAPGLYRFALRLVSGIALVPAALLALVAALIDGDASLRAGLVIVAIGTPVSGAFVVSQAVLQGMERVLLLTWVTFLARVLSMIWLVFALYRGAGVEAAFVSRLMFQALSVAVFFVMMWRERGDRVVGFTARDLLTRSVPFALNRAVGELSSRLPSLVLPGTVGLAATGVFDSANRIRNTLGMAMSAAIVGMMPSFARTLADPHPDSGPLVGYSVKYMCLAMAAVATVLAVGSDWIIKLLFGTPFSGAAGPLQILIWAQVVVAVDAVLQQVMLAAGHEYAAVRNSGLGAIAQLALIVPLSFTLGLPGVALAVLLSCALALVLDLRFVVRQVSGIGVLRVAARPVAAACLISVVMLAVQEQLFAVRALAAAGSWAAALLLFRLLPRQEMQFIWRVASAQRLKRAGPGAG